MRQHEYPFIKALFLKGYSLVEASKATGISAECIRMGLAREDGRYVEMLNKLPINESIGADHWVTLLCKAHGIMRQDVARHFGIKYGSITDFCRKKGMLAKIRKAIESGKIKPLYEQQREKRRKAKNPPGYNPITDIPANFMYGSPKMPPSHLQP